MKLVVVLVVALMFVATSAQAAERPNIIFILADDLGITGVSAYGAHEIHSPTSTSRYAQACR